MSASRLTSQRTRQRADLPGHALGALQVDVGDHHATRALGGEPLCQAGADAAGAAGDDRDLSSNVHAFPPVGRSIGAGACVPSHEGDSWDGARPPAGQAFRRSAISLRSDTLFGVASYAAGVGDG